MYHFNNLGRAELLSHILSHNYGGAFKATVFHSDSEIGCDGANVRIAVTSDSLTLLKGVIDSIVRGAHIQVVSFYPNDMNLHSSLGLAKPPEPLDVPGVSLN